MVKKRDTRIAKMRKPRIYADNNSTTIPHKNVVNAMAAAARHAGNPSNTHHKDGRAALALIEKCRTVFANRLGVPATEIYFTSGGTEANNTLVWQLANIGTRKRRCHIVVSAIEHKCMLEACLRLRGHKFTVSVVKPDSGGVIQPESLRAALRPNTAFVSIMFVNNETGVRNDVNELARITHRVGAYFLCDCAQAMGKLHIRPTHLGMDALTCSAHKFHGPKGVGMMWIRKKIAKNVKPLLVGGPQEMHLRAGTENVPGIVGAAKALLETWDKGDKKRVKRNRHLLAVTTQLINDVRAHFGDKLVEIGDKEQRMPHVVLIGIDIPGLCNAKLLKFLDTNGVSASIGSACNTGSSSASHVIRAMHVKPNVVKSTVRFSMSDSNTVKEASRIASVFIRAVECQLTKAAHKPS